LSKTKLWLFVHQLLNSFGSSITRFLWKTSTSGWSEVVANTCELDGGMRVLESGLQGAATVVDIG